MSFIAVKFEISDIATINILFFWFITIVLYLFANDFGNILTQFISILYLFALRISFDDSDSLFNNKFVDLFLNIFLFLIDDLNSLLVILLIAINILSIFVLISITP